MSDLCPVLAKVQGMSPTQTNEQEICRRAAEIIAVSRLDKLSYVIADCSCASGLAHDLISMVGWAEPTLEVCHVE